jgi:hypothetical protein
MADLDVVHLVRLGSADSAATTRQATWGLRQRLSGLPRGSRPSRIVEFPQLERRAWDSNPRARSPLLAVFKWVRGSASERAPTWTFSVSTCYVTQDHPAHIPRAVQHLIRWMVIEHLIRRSVPRVQPMRRNPYSEVSVLPGVRYGCRSPVPSAQSVRKL